MKRCCCGCCTVRTGTLIIGILTLISATFQVGKCCIKLAVAFQELSTLGDQSAREIKLEVGIAISLATLLFAVIHLCLTISLLSGVSTDNHRPILPWYYYNLVVFVISVIATAGITIWLLVIEQYLAVLCVAIVVSPTFWLVWHLLSVVKDYIDELKNGYIRENLNMGTSGVRTGKSEKA